MWKEGVRWKDHKRVAISYMRGSLAYDLACRLPWESLVAGLVTGRYTFGYGHLCRLLLAPRAIAFIENPFKHPRTGIRTGHARNLSAAAANVTHVQGFLVVHWYACLLWCVAETLENHGKETWLTLASELPADWERVADVMRVIICRSIARLSR